MKIGRNDPCPCASGKKYKKCCLPKDEVTHSAEVARAAPPPARAPWAADLDSDWGEDDESVDPLDERRGDIYARLDDAGSADELFALLDEVLREPDLMDGELAMNLFGELFREASAHDQHERFEGALRRLREQVPEAYAEEAGLLTAWRAQSALARGDRAALQESVQEIAGFSEQRYLAADLMDRLAFHGHGRLVAALAIALFGAADAEDELRDDPALPVRAGYLVVLDGLERGEIGDQLTPELAGRLSCFAPLDGATAELFVAYVSGRERVALTAEELPKRDLRSFLSPLSMEFVGWLRREEGVAYSIGELARETLCGYFLERGDGARPKKGSRRRRSPVERAGSTHPLCPDRATLGVFVDDLLDRAHIFDPYRLVAALEVLPGWLRFLCARGLLDDANRQQTLEALRPVVASAAKTAADEADPELAKALAKWPRPAPAGGRIPAAGDADVAWRIAPPPRAPNPIGSIDWVSAIAGGVSTENLLEDPLHEAIEIFVHWLEQGRFLTWEAVIRKEQGLALSRRHRQALDEMIDFSDDEDEERRVLQFDGLGRPDRPWYDTLRVLAARLVIDLPIRTSAVHGVDATESWARIVGALKAHGVGLSLPEGAVTPIDVVPTEVRQRLWLLQCCDPLLGIGQPCHGAPMTLADPEERGRIDAFIDRLREHRDAVALLGLTLETLPQLVELPPLDQELLAATLARQLLLPSRQAPIAPALLSRDQGATH